VEEVMDAHPPLLQATQGVEQAVSFMDERGLRFAYVVDADRRLRGYVRARDLQGKTGWVDEFVEPAATAILMGTSLKDALSGMLVVDYANVCVVDAHKRVRGLVNTGMIHKAVVESEASSSEGEEE
jgi:CBS domain-containing protein